MSNDALRNDLVGALELKSLVRIELATGESLLTRLVYWPEDEDWFTVWDPQTLGDPTSSRKIFSRPGEFLVGYRHWTQVVPWKVRLHATRLFVSAIGIN